MNTYKITDLYIAAYLKALWFTCEIQTVSKRCFFIFSESAKEKVSSLMKSSDKETLNINAWNLINEIKQLKSYVNNI